MKTNVILITYNHSQCIAQAIESILMQKTTHDVSIIVADDCSTDDTLSIIEGYSKNSPFEFLFLEKTSNLGLAKNYQRAYAACDGDYVAIMEGDDYWVQPDHIQQHADFLENHPECSMSFNRHLRVFVDQNREEVFDWTTNNDFEYLTTEQLALGNRIGNLSCCVFRGELIRKLDKKLFEMNVADWMMGMYMGLFGSIVYLKKVTSAYRIHDNGQWSRMTEKEQSEKVIEAINLYNDFFDYKYNDAFSTHKRRLEAVLYGDKSMKGRLKSITPAFLRRLYRKIIN